jgi:hypothetical protein
MTSSLLDGSLSLPYSVPHRRKGKRKIFSYSLQGKKLAHHALLTSNILMNLKIIPLSSALLCSSLVLCHALDLKIPLTKVPTIVQCAIRQEAGSNRIIQVEKAEDAGQIRYEALTEKRDGKTIEFIFKSDGTLVSTEEPIERAELPEIIAETLKEAIGNGRISLFEKVVSNGIATYEVSYKSSKGEKREAAASSVGTLLRNGPDVD